MDAVHDCCMIERKQVEKQVDLLTAGAGMLVFLVAITTIMGISYTPTPEFIDFVVKGVSLLFAYCSVEVVLTSLYRYIQ